MKPTRDYIRSLALELRTAAVLAPKGVAVWWDIEREILLALRADSPIACALLDCMHGAALATCVGVFAAPVSRSEIEDALLAHVGGRIAA